jgi:hypothetical protein
MWLTSRVRVAFAIGPTLVWKTRPAEASDDLNKEK